MWKFIPIYKSTIWGGDLILPYKMDSAAQTRIGESWEISGVPGSESVVESGEDAGLTLSQLCSKYGAGLLGERNYRRFGNSFPLLIKFIDAHSDLSVQVHPNDELARRRGMPNGKSEMWYVVSARPGSRLACGFTHPVSPDSYEELVESGRIEDVLNYFTVKSGDVFYMPSGRVHAIGSGVFLVEIQQTSDATYRIYDYHRRDKDGNERQLHTDLARDAINFGDADGHPVRYTEHPDIPVNLLKTKFFTTNVLDIDREVMRDYSESDTFVALVAIEGEALITCGDETQTLSRGHSILIPADANGITISPKDSFKALETYIS